MNRYDVVSKKQGENLALAVNQREGYLPYGAPLLVGDTFHQMMVTAKESKILLLTSLVGLGSNFPSPSARSALMARSVDDVVRELSS